ncbi:MAG: hypothetical protein OXE77_00555 [Flavobacteriaceae bacterium]|nr:hypothetical protein [Flavobacteriaceae bacterium]MCY4266342.1 hypothetical protein [Flavobacteriaceae bacterium]MCY4299306.1 hypothetical protein [Flavobacteriaceae bacterium]
MKNLNLLLCLLLLAIVAFSFKLFDFELKKITSLGENSVYAQSNSNNDCEAEFYPHPGGTAVYNTKNKKFLFVFKSKGCKSKCGHVCQL